MTVYQRASTSGPWIDATYANSWVDFDAAYHPVQYRRNGDRVELRGVAKDGSPVNGTIFTLPVGFRPAFDMAMASIANDSLCRIVVLDSGAVSAPFGGSATWTSLDGLSFSVAL